MFSIVDEIAKLGPIDMSASPSKDQAGTSEVDRWNEMTKNVGRLGKQQMRTTQMAEMIAQQVEQAVSSFQNFFADSRRELLALREEGRTVRLRVLDCIDMLDDLTTVARQRDDAQWLGRLEKLTSRTLETFNAIGLTEVPTSDRVFNEQEHEALETVERKQGQPALHIVEVLRRGFRFDGAVLRRSQVITTR